MYVSVSYMLRNHRLQYSECAAELALIWIHERNIRWSNGEPERLRRVQYIPFTVQRFLNAFSNSSPYTPI